MSFLRKATWVATGGMSGLVIKANSKKERIANAMEKQVKLQGRQVRITGQAAPSSPSPGSRSEPRASDSSSLVARGALYHAQVRVHHDTVTITRTGSKAKGRHLDGQLSFPLADVTGVQLQEPTPAAFGFITFLSGDEEFIDAATDEYTVAFSGQQMAPFLAIRDYVEDRIAQANEDSRTDPSLAQAENVCGAPSLSEELDRLARLHRDGDLSDDEFQSAKDRLLAM
jgi:hypothetical protein